MPPRDGSVSAPAELEGASAASVSAQLSGLPSAAAPTCGPTGGLLAKAQEKPKWPRSAWHGCWPRVDPPAAMPALHPTSTARSVPEPVAEFADEKANLAITEANRANEEETKAKIQTDTSR